MVAAALACISTLALRVKENSKILFETGIAENIVESMRLHAKNKIVQVCHVFIQVHFCLILIENKYF